MNKTINKLFFFTLTIIFCSNLYTKTLIPSLINLKNVKTAICKDPINGNILFQLNQGIATATFVADIEGKMLKYSLESLPEIDFVISKNYPKKDSTSLASLASDSSGLFGNIGISCPTAKCKSLKTSNQEMQFHFITANPNIKFNQEVTCDF